MYANLSHAWFLTYGGSGHRRQSLASLSALYRRGVGEFAGGKWLSLVEASGWIDHLSRVLAAAHEVASRVGESRQTVVVHCSDGWDRTAQLSALASILLDPFHRTRVGFAILVQ